MRADDAARKFPRDCDWFDVIGIFALGMLLGVVIGWWHL